MTISIGKWRGLQRISDGAGHYMMLAADQRPPIKNPIARHFPDGIAPYTEVARFKRMLVDVLQAHASAVLLDPYYCLSSALLDLRADKGLIVTLEDSVFQETPGGRLSSVIPDWSVEKIKAMGADAVKVLAWYRPDAAAQVLDHQQRFVRQIGDACRQFDIPFLLELLVYPMEGEDEAGKGYEEMSGKKAEQVIDSVREFADPKYGVDIFKLECPLSSSAFPAVGAPGSAQAHDLFKELDRLVARPWVMLSAGAGAGDFRNVLEHACRAGASGFLAGRAIWQEAFSAYPDWDRIEAGLRSDSLRVLQDLAQLTAQTGSGKASAKAIAGLQANLSAMQGDAVSAYQSQTA